MTSENMTIRTKLKDMLFETQDVMSELRKNLQMYNAHKHKVSPTYRKKMEKMKSNLNLVTSFSQCLFVCSYSYIFLKLVAFNHYKKFNFLTKFFLITFYCATIEPATLASCNFYVNIILILISISWNSFLSEIKLFPGSVLIFI